MMVTAKRPRFTFWLDLTKPDEEKLAGQIMELKQQRSFTKTIRDGIRLIIDLSQGKTDVLEELFPWVLEQKKGAESTQESAVQTGDGSLKAHLERLEQLILQNGGMGDAGRRGEGREVLAFSARVSTPKNDQHSEQSDRALLEIRKAGVSEDDKPTWNFMISSALSVYGHCNFLPSEIIEYGVQRGKITPVMLKHSMNSMNGKKVAEQARSRKNATGAGKQQDKLAGYAIRQEHGSAKVMDVPQLAPSQCEDDDLGLVLVVKMPGA